MSNDTAKPENLSHLYEQLLTLNANHGSIDDVGEVIAQFPRLFVLPPSPALIKHLQDSQAQNSVPENEMWIPELHGTLIPGGFAPALFTTFEFAHHIAKLNNHIPEGSAILIQSTGTAYMLMARLVAGAAGVIIDGGQPHKLCLNAMQLSRVAAIANRSNFAKEQDLITLRNKDGEPIFVTQGVTQILCYDESINSEVIKDFLQKNFGIEHITFVRESASTLIHDGVAAGAQQLTVNAGLHSMRVYSGSDLKIMSEISLSS